MLEQRSESRVASISPVGLQSRISRRALKFGRLAAQKPLGAIAGVFLIIMILAAVFAELVAPYGPYEIDPRNGFLSPSATYLMGTDQIGRDHFSRIVFGARVSLQVGGLAVGIGMTIATLVGATSALVGGRTDAVIQRFSDALQTIPGIILAMALVSVLGPSTLNVMLAITVVIVPFNQRVVRGATLGIKENVYIEAARAVGASETRILFRHILPNVMATVIVLSSLVFGFAILIEAALSFLGLGTPPPTPSWGMMLSSDGRDFMERAPWLTIFPGLAITFAVLAFNLFGDALRDILDPRLRGT